MTPHQLDALMTAMAIAVIFAPTLMFCAIAWKAMTKSQAAIGTVILGLLLGCVAVAGILMALAGCGGSGSSGQGDKPVGDGQNVQTKAVVMIHRAGEDEVIDYGK